MMYENIKSPDIAELRIAPVNLPRGSRLSLTHLVYIKNYPSGRTESYLYPLYMLIKPWSAGYRRKGSYQVYRHSFFEDSKNYGKMDTYIGVTKQRWQVRYRQHLQSARSGSPYLMHKAIREEDKYEMMEHEVYAAGLSYEEAMNCEESLVERYSLHPNGLNMIPGGFAGLRYLALMNALKPRETGEFKDRVISELMTGKRSSNLGEVNSLIAEHWENPEYAEAVICNRDDRFSPEEVRMIRILGSCDWDIEKIVNHLNLSDSEKRVAALLKGRTYNRIV